MLTDRRGHEPEEGSEMILECVGVCVRVRRSLPRLKNGSQDTAYQVLLTGPVCLGRKFLMPNYCL